jgi:SAM-dependent methyltransferase
MMTDPELASFYAGYTKKVATEDEDDLLFSTSDAEVDTLTASQARFVAGHVGAPSGHVLDIGCGKGSFLKAFHALRPGWTCAGVEPSRDEAEIARRDGTLDIHQGMFEDAPLDGGSFDLVSIMHVLEHVSRPADVVRRLRALVKPGGLLFVEVPNVLDPNMFYDVLLFEHLFHFPAATLSWFLEREGFDIVATEPSTPYGAQRIVARKSEVGSGRSVQWPAVRMREGRDAWTRLWEQMHGIADAGAARIASGRRVALFGAGMTAATWLVYTSLHGAAVAGCLDESRWKIGRTFFGTPVVALADADALRVDTILIATMPATQRLVAEKLAPLRARGVDVMSLEG